MAAGAPCGELRMVVLGGMLSGKTSLIETVLGLEETGPVKENVRGTEFGPSKLLKRSAHNLKKEGYVVGRKLVLVNTHGWWRNYRVIDTAEFIKRELVLSLTHCAPGPHAFILTIRIDIPFDEDHRRAIEQHLGLFGENIWGYTIVVFTRGGSLKDRTIEQHIESEGEALKWLVEKCGNRYCVFDQHSRDKKQITEWLEKIESIVIGNSGRHFELDGKSLNQVEEKRKDVKERAHARLLRTQNRKKQTADSQVFSIPEIRILLLGWVSSRKTSAKNTILDIQERVTTRTTSVQTQTGEVAGQKVTVVDTPSWWKYFSAQSTPKWVKRELRKSLSLGSKAPHAILLAVPSDTTFPEEQRKITEDNMKIFGDQVWRHTIVLFTCGDLLGDTSIEEHIESEGEPLRWLVEKCGNQYHVFNNINRGDGSQVTELLDKIKEMEARNSSLANETEDVEVMQTTEPEGLGVEIGEVLDTEWCRMDKQIEMKIRKLWTPSIGNQSIGSRVDFKENVHSQKYFTPVKSDESVVGESPFKSETGDKKHILEALQRLLGQTSSELLENIKDTIERECGRQEAIIMERARGILQEIHGSHDMTSEPDQHDYEQAREKVCRWLAGTSGIGSEGSFDGVAD